MRSRAAHAAGCGTSNQEVSEGCWGGEEEAEEEWGRRRQGFHGGSMEAGQEALTMRMESPTMELQAAHWNTNGPVICPHPKHTSHRRHDSGGHQSCAHASSSLAPFDHLTNMISFLHFLVFLCLFLCFLLFGRLISHTCPRPPERLQRARHRIGRHGLSWPLMESSMIIRPLRSMLCPGGVFFFTPALECSRCLVACRSPAVKQTCRTQLPSSIPPPAPSRFASYSLRFPMTFSF